MTRKFFGTDGVRGRVGEAPLTVDFAVNLASAAARVLAPEGGSVLIGKDTRLSGYMFEAALEAGFIASGLDVMLIGPLPTPGIAYMTRHFGCRFGVVISASHNDYHDNGIKLFDANQAVLTPLVWKGLADSVPLGRPQAIVVAVPQGQAARIKTQVLRPDPLYAPLQMNQAVATLKVFLDQAPLSEMPLLALKPVPEAGWFGRTYDTLKLWVR